MRCLDNEQLMSYVYRLADEATESRVRAHIDECSHCREVVEQHARLNAALDAWKVEGPSPAFDVRVRQAIEAQEARRVSGFWGWGWARGIALASLGVLLAAGAFWFTHSSQRGSNSPAVAVNQTKPAIGPQAPAHMSPAGTAPVESANLQHAAAPARLHVRPAQAASQGSLNTVNVAEDKDAQALEDYDLAANFDPLSEIPKGEQRVAE